MPDRQAAGADQRLGTDLIGNRESGAIDDDVDGVVDAIDGADARRGQGGDRRRDQRGAGPGVPIAGSWSGVTA